MMNRTDGASFIHLLIVLLVLVLVLILVFILLILALRLKNSHSNAVEVTHAILRDDTATLRADLNHTNCLEALKHLALDRGRGATVVLGTEAAVLRATVELAERTDTDRLVQVDVASQRGSTNVPPVWVVRSLLLEGSRLYNIDPRRHFNLTCSTVSFHSLV